MYPFAVMHKGVLRVKLHKDLYPREAINRLREYAPESVVSCVSSGQYYLVEPAGKGPADILELFDRLAYFIRHI